jgi:hypothetical protein
VLQGDPNAWRDVIAWYKQLYWIPGRLLVWLAVAVLVVTLVAWITHDNIPKAKPKQIRMTKGIADSNKY